MLANCGRILLRRAAFEVPKTDRLALLQRVAIAHNGYLNLACTAQTSSIDNYNASARRSYATTATPAKPKAHTGKAKARTRKPAAKSTTAAPKKPASTAKKPAPKKTKKAIPSTKKAPPKKPKAATRAKAKPRKKTAPKPRVRKPKSDRQKALEVKRKERDALTELKETALIGKVPKKLPEDPFHILVEQMTKEARIIGAASKEASAKAKNLTPEELEHYNHIGNQNKATNEAAYKKVVEEHTPEQIRVANNARRLLKRRYKVRHGVGPIRDERQVKSPTGPYNLFFKARLDSGDFKHMKITDMGRLVGAEWRGLTQEEKDKYIRQSNLDKSRYRFEVKTVYGRDSRSTAASKAAT